MVEDVGCFCDSEYGSHFTEHVSLWYARGFFSNGCSTARKVDIEIRPKEGKWKHLCLRSRLTWRIEDKTSRSAI